MKILFLTRLFFPHIGGVETHAFEIAKRLVGKGHAVTVITEEPEEEKKEKIEGIQIIRIPAGNNLWLKKFRIWVWLWLNREVLETVDIIHCHDVFFWYLPFRFFYFKKPVYTTFHGYEGVFPPSWKARVIRKISERLSSGTICVGDYIKKWYGTKPDYITYGGVDTQKIQVRSNRTQNSEPKASAEKLKILFVGRLEPDMGLLIYAKALRILKKEGIKFHFEALGDGSLQKLAKKFGKVHGFKRNLSFYIQKADIVFASSYLLILTVFKFKKPIIAAYSNPLKKDYLILAPFAKWIFISRSAKEIVNAVKKCLKEKTRIESMTDKALRWVESQDWDKIVDIYLRLWKKKKYP